MPDFYQLLRVKGEGDALVDEARRIRSFGILKSLKMFEKDMIRTRLSKNSFKVNIKPGVRQVALAIWTASGAPKGSKREPPPKNAPCIFGIPHIYPCA
jgi:hypothetical protein